MARTYRKVPKKSNKKYRVAKAILNTQLEKEKLLESPIEIVGINRLNSLVRQYPYYSQWDKVKPASSYEQWGA